jgi:aminoglycoside phosphotransferase family enzyme/predicted kinase
MKRRMNLMDFDRRPPANPANLLQPQSFIHRVDRITMLETHISWVFLTGSFAYKVKKPVSFPFLDYSSLASRQKFCQLELERNRKWAGDLYIDLVGLHGEEGTIHIGEADSQVEWAIRMHEFSQDDCLAKLAQKGPLPQVWIDDLAEHLVAAHQQADSVELDSAYGRAESLKDQLIQCFIDINHASQHQSQSIDCGRLEILIFRKLEALGQLLNDRRTAGRVRECHGDLHLSNLIRWKGKTVGFDAIEFNADFYWIDVWSDVAFAIMDLDSRGQYLAAARLLNCYAEYSGDYQGLECLTAYLAYRAMVRARINALRIIQNPPQSQVANEALSEMMKYLKLAEGYFQERPLCIWITHGVSGSGKSSGMLGVIDRGRMVRVRSDVERKRLAGLKSLDKGPASIYTPEFSKATYQRCMELSRQILKAGFPVIIDATFLKRWQRDLVYQLGKELTVPVHIARFEAEPSELISRVMNRKGDASDATVEVVLRQLAEQEPLSDEELQWVGNAGEKSSLYSPLEHKSS